MNEILSRLDSYYHLLLKMIPRIGLAIIVLVAGILIANWITSLLQKKIRSRSHDQLMSTFLAKTLKLIFFIIIFLLTLNILGLSAISKAIFATAGASAIIIGFAFKDIAENFLAGIILAFNRPFNVSDTVQIEDVFGQVIKMEFRYTKIDTFDGKSVYIPNADVLTKPVFNYTEDGFFRTDFILGIAYENDTNEAKKIIQKCLDENKELVQDEHHVNFVVEDEVAPSTVNLKTYIWVEQKISGAICFRRVEGQSQKSKQLLKAMDLIFLQKLRSLNIMMHQVLLKFKIPGLLRYQKILLANNY